MIHYLEGPVEAVRGDQVILRGQGMGWSIFMSPGLRQRLESFENDIYRIYIYVHVREDIFAFYGFPTEDDKRLFEILLSITGVGPKLAQAILDTFSPDHFALSVLNQDVKSLTRVKGLGKKTAERLILELKDKLKAPEWVQDMGEVNETEAPVDDQNFQAVLEALGVLGYTGAEAKDLAAKHYDEAAAVDENIRTILKQAGQSR